MVEILIPGYWEAINQLLLRFKCLPALNIISVYFYCSVYMYNTLYILYILLIIIYIIINTVHDNIWLSWQLECQIQLTGSLFCIVNYGCR